MANEEDHNCIDDDKLIADIKNFGWSVLLVEAGNYLPDFAYTVGLWKNYNHPELISFGLTSQTLHSILNIAGDMVKSGEKLSVNNPYDDFFENGPAKFLKVDMDNITDYFGYAMWFNKYEEFPALQLVWTDRNSNFPWEDNFEKEFKYRQPLLDRNMGFKFMESENLATFTTRQWIEFNKPILRVVHEIDGDWQFLTGDQMPEDVRIVALKELVLRDKTLNEVFDLDYGESAERTEAGGEWIRHEIESEDDQ
jgi:hypothetical protein